MELTLPTVEKTFLNISRKLSIELVQNKGSTVVFELPITTARENENKKITNITRKNR